MNATRSKGLGTFGGANPRVVFAGVQPDPALKALRDRLRSLAREAGINLPHERFVPHVTLARLGPDPDIGLLAQFLQSEGGLQLPPFHPEALILWQSRLHPNGARYEDLSRYPV